MKVKATAKKMTVLPTTLHTAYCPHCRAVTNLKVSITLQGSDSEDGKEETIVSRTYHCESCCFFVRSEEAPDVIEFFKKQGRGYQSMINAVLRKYVEFTVINSGVVS